MMINEETVTKAIEREIRERTNIAVDKVITEAVIKLENEIMASVDSVVLSVLAEYEVRTRDNKLIIEVKKQL